jgi:signal transduction histidine kinase
MRTIGFRLTGLYVCAVASVVGGIFFLGEFLLEHQIRGNIDTMLADGFAQLRGRLTTDPVRSNLDLAELLPGQPAATRFVVELVDRWQDPAFRAARMRGDPAPPEAPPRYSDAIGRDGGPVRVLEGDAESLRLRIATSLAPVSRAVDSYLHLGLVVSAGVLGMSVVAGYLLSRTALRPIRLIERTAARIRGDNLSERIPVGQVSDEISALAHLLNQTFDRLEASFEQIQRFSAEVSHELKTPLSLIRLNVERLVGTEPLTAAGKEALQDAIEEIHGLDQLIERLLFLSRAQAGEVQLEQRACDPREFIRTFWQDSVALAEARAVAYTVLTNQAGWVRFDTSRMRQVLFNLLANALAAIPGKGTIALSSEFVRGLWRITLEDDGVGLAEDKCELIFERFVRISSSSGSGGMKNAGLGLAICRSIVQLHGGKIFATPRPGEPGLRLIIEIPAGTAQPPPA